MSTNIKKISVTLISAILMMFILSNTVTAKGNLSVSKDIELNASPETVWKLIGPFNNLDAWHPMIIDSKMQGDESQAGTTRTLTLGDGAKIFEKLLAHSNSDLSYSYAITKSPLPVKDYVSSISIAAIKDGKSLVTWTSTFDAFNASNEKATEVITGVYNAGLENLAALFNN